MDAPVLADESMTEAMLVALPAENLAVNFMAGTPSTAAAFAETVPMVAAGSMAAVDSTAADTVAGVANHSPAN
jgi:hypothetical protein